ncbi:MAG: winged helix-turn-helix transcriptional regulator [Hyphomonadaceae bacterium]
MNAKTKPARARRHSSKDYCPVEAALHRIGGKWKALIVLRLLAGPRRFNEMQRGLSGCTQRVLTNQLRDLEADGLIHREIFAEVPPRVEYSLTPAGAALEPIVRAMCEWGQEHVLGDAPDFARLMRQLT